MPNLLEFGSTEELFPKPRACFPNNHVSRDPHEKPQDLTRLPLLPRITRVLVYYLVAPLPTASRSVTSSPPPRRRSDEAPTGDGRILPPRRRRGRLRAAHRRGHLQGLPRPPLRHPPRPHPRYAPAPLSPSLLPATPLSTET
jgi:hypothetical protein